RKNATVISLPYPNLSAQKLKKMIASPNPTNPPPLMVPSSLWVNPNWLPQSSRITPRTEKPIPAATRVQKLAQKRILLLALGPSADCAGVFGFTDALRGVSAGECRASLSISMSGFYEKQAARRANPPRRCDFAPFADPSHPQSGPPVLHPR